MLTTWQLTMGDNQIINQKNCCYGCVKLFLTFLYIHACYFTFLEAVGCSCVWLVKPCTVSVRIVYVLYCTEVESRTQGSRPRTQKKSEAKAKNSLSEDRHSRAKDRNARGQGQGPRTQAQVLSKKKKRSSQKFFKRSPPKNVFQKIFQALHKILTIQKIALSSSRGQANFRGLKASRPRTWPSRPRTSKCVLQAKDVLEDSTSGTVRIYARGGVEDTRLEAKNTKKIWGQGQK